MTAEAAEIQLQEDIADTLDNPYAFVMYVFDWGVGELKDETGPDEWQTGILKYIGDNILTLQQALQIAMRSGTETGKTALIAWLIIWYTSTRKDAHIVVTANTGAQLEKKTWRELAKWHKLSINQHWHTWTATKFYNNKSPETWFAEAQPWSLENSQAFAGTHDTYVMMIFDEASEIPDKIWEVAEGAASKPGHLWLGFGNPSQNTGRFAECFKKYRHRWYCVEIDARTAKKSDKGKIQQWIEDYGEDSDFVRVRVKGQEPRSSSHQIFSYDIVAAAMGRQIHISNYMHAAIILGVDIARFGDDQTVFTIRQGLAITHQKAYRNLDAMMTASYIAEWIEVKQVDACFLDMGYVGAAVYDRLTRHLGYTNITGVDFGGAARANKEYFNKCAEMWWDTLEWMKTGGCIPDCNELRDDLTGRQYGFDKLERKQLECKKDMKARGLASPDYADSLALTFAHPVQKKQRLDRGRMQLQDQDGGKPNDPFDWI